MVMEMAQIHPKWLEVARKTKLSKQAETELQKEFFDVFLVCKKFKFFKPKNGNEIQASSALFR